jgi:hypothetical protein
LAELANALDPVGSGKWKLSFKRPRVGNPTTPLRSALRLAELGSRALALYEIHKNWQRVDEELDKEKSDATDNKLRKRAVALVRRGRRESAKKPRIAYPTHYHETVVVSRSVPQHSAERAQETQMTTPLAYPVEKAGDAAGVSRTRIFEAIKNKELTVNRRLGMTPFTPTISVA